MMPRSNTPKAKSSLTNTRKAKSAGANPFQLRESEQVSGKQVTLVHVFKTGETGETKVICDTDSRGHATPKGRTPLEIVLDASEGFIPL